MDKHGETYRERYKEQGDLVSVLLFFQNEGMWAKNVTFLFSAAEITEKTPT